LGNPTAQTAVAQVPAPGYGSDASCAVSTLMVVLAKTASRTILGFMNEIALHARFQIEGAGGLDSCDISALNHRLRRSLHNYSGTYAYPIDRLLERQRDVAARLQHR
jgi:hypothetical protein